MKQILEQHGLDEEAYKWYLELRKYGSVPHSGFGLGLERTVAWISGVEHVRETIPFPRLIKPFISLIIFKKGYYVDFVIAFFLDFILL